MSEPTKPTDNNSRWWMGLIAAIAIAALVYLGYPKPADPVPEPTASPTTSPSPTASPSPSPTPTAVAELMFSTSGLDKPAPENGYTLPLGSSAAISIARAEIGSRIAHFGGSACKALSLQVPTGLSVQIYKMESLTTTQPSHKGAILGKHYDALVPTTSACPGDWLWIDVAASESLAAGLYDVRIGGAQIEVTISSIVMPIRPTMPLYVGLGSYALIKGHKLPADTGVSVQGPLTKAYVDMFRAHRIEPQGQYIVNPPLKTDGTLDFDQWSTSNASFRQLVISGAIAPIMVRSPAATSSTWASAAQLQGWQKAIVADPDLAGAWTYITDEPTDYAGVATRAQFVRTNAPALKIMVTTEPRTELLTLVDHFAPVFEFFKSTGRWQDYTKAPNFFLYGSCMSHGACVNGQVGTLTGTPDLMLDEATIFARMFPVVSYVAGAKAALYYNSVEAYGKLDPWVNQYQFAGNGDGQLVYPGIAGERGFISNQPVSSIRMKMLRQGMFDIEYLKRLPIADVKAVLGDLKTWPRNHTAIDTLRSRAGAL